jgi:hypothetical protein
MKKISLLLSILLLSSNCLAFDGVSAGASQMEMMSKHQFQMDTFSDKSIKFDDGARFIFVPRKVDEEQEKKLKLFMRSCNDCQEVPIIGGDGGGRSPLPATGASELCKKYPFIKGCKQ